jgi:hypothetical protein
LDAGVPESHSGPFFAFATQYSPPHMAQAIEYLQDTLEDEGPIDGIFAFSQSAALTLSYLYQQQMAGNLIDIKFACLFSSVLPCSADSNWGTPIMSRSQYLNLDITDQARCNDVNLTIGERELVSIIQQTIIKKDTQGSHFSWLDTSTFRDWEPETVPCVLLPSSLAQKIKIPTIHCWGQSDSEYMIRMAEVSRSICDESLAKTVLHPGAHDIPRREPEIKAILRTIDWAMAQS